MRVHSTKYDGSLHYRYATRLLSRSDRECRLVLDPGTPTESYRGASLARYTVRMVFFADRPYNVHLSLTPEGTVRHYYVNVASVATWDDQVLRFVDLDLDLIWRPALDQLLVDDEDEFEEHRVAMGYPDALVREALATVAEVKDAIAARRFPFDGSLE